MHWIGRVPILIFALVLGWAVAQSAPILGEAVRDAHSAPLAQATATPTITATPTVTPTPTPRTLSLGGQPLPCIDAGLILAGTCSLSTAASVAAGEAHIGAVGGNTVAVSATVTRPADTTPYTARDAISNSTSSPSAITFADMCRVANGSGYIVGARFATDQAANVAQYRLWLYNAAPTAINDNAPQTSLWVDNDKRVGYLDFPAAAQEAGSSTAAVSVNFDARIPYVCAGGSTNLSGLLETLTAFTPSSGQNFFLGLLTSRN